MTRKASIILVLAILATLLAVVSVSAGQGTPAASAIPGSENQSTARQGHETGTATQAGPCGPACRAQQVEPVEPVEPPTTITVTVTVTKTVYVVYCPLIASGAAPVTVAPDLLDLPGDAN